MEDVKKIKCSKCGTLNIYGAKVCGKCKAKLDRGLKSCPKCAKRNSIDTKKCNSCGFKFDKEKDAKKSILINLMISLLLMGFLCLLVILNKSGVVNNINKIFKVVAIVLVVCLVIGSLNYNNKDKINYTAEEEMIDKNERTNKMKIISNVAIIVGCIIILVLLVYFYFHR